MADEQPRALKRTRGLAKLEFLSKIPPGTKLTLTIEGGIPYGKNSTELAAYVGKLAKDGEYFPFDEPVWSKIEDKAERVRRVKDDLENIFHFPEECDRWIDTTLNHSWRLHKYRMKLKYFDPYSNNTEWYANCPKNVIPAQWKNMVHYWHTDPHFKKASETNKKNKAKSKDPHIGGSKSNMNYAKEIEAATNEKVTRSMIYKKTHRRSNGTVASEVANERIRKIDEILSTGAEDVVLFQESSVDLGKDIYSKVVGPEKKGRWGVVGPRMKFDRVDQGASSSTSKDDKIKNLSEQVEMLRTTIDQMKEELYRLSSQVHMYFILHCLCKSFRFCTYWIA